MPSNSSECRLTAANHPWPEMVFALSLSLVCLACQPGGALEPEGGPNRGLKVTDGRFFDTAIRPSSDGRRLLITRRYGDTNGGSASLWVMRPDGSNARRVPTPGPWDAEGDWSPDATAIVYVAYADGGPDEGTESDLWILDLETEEQRLFTGQPGIEGQPDWSPDGEWIAYQSYGNGSSDLWLQAVAGGEPRRLTERGSNDFSPIFSPDGGRILFRSDRAGGNTDVYVLDRDAGTVQRLTHHVASDWNPKWSPDGRRVLFTSTRGGQIDIWEKHLDDGSIRQLTASPSIESSPIWSHDGSLLYLTVFERSQTVGIVDHDTGRLSSISDAGFESEPIEVEPGTWAAISRGDLVVWRGQARRILLDDPPVDLRLDRGGALGPLVVLSRDVDGGTDVYRVGLDGARTPWTRFGDVDGVAACTGQAAIVFTRALADRRELWRAGIDGAPRRVDEIGAVRLLSCHPTEPKILGQRGGDLVARDLSAPAWQEIAVTKPPVAGARWSPDGSQIAYIGSSGRSRDLFVHDMVTGSSRQMTAVAGNVGSPSWSLDGRALLISVVSGHANVWRFDLPTDGPIAVPP